MYERSHNGIRNASAAGFADRLRDAITHEEAVVAVLGTDADAVLAIVNDCVEMLADQPIRVVRFGGSQGSPLTLPRIVRELGAAERGGPPADDDELIVRVLTKPRSKQGRTLLIIEHAELLPLRTLVFLQIISTVFGAVTPMVQIVFAGHPKFKLLIERDELTGLRDRLGTVIQVASAPASMVPSIAVRPKDSGTARNKASPNFISGHRKKVLVLLVGLLTVIGGALAILQQSRYGVVNEGRNAAATSDLAQADPPANGMIAQTPPPSPAPLPQTAAPEPSRLSTPPQSSVEQPDSMTTAQPAMRQGKLTNEQLARLRGEFDHFLAQTKWGSGRQSESERSRLFNEFLLWNYGAAGGGLELSPQILAVPLLSRARVTVHFPAGSASGAAMARRFAATLRPSVALARTRSAANVPAVFELRYFAPEDEGVAETLAQMLQSPDVTWSVRMMPGSQPAPAPHTVEFWIPLR
jgi:hypothetical protein